MDYTTLSLAEVSRELDILARDAAATFGGLDPRQLNWRPDVKRWSVGQCFQHLVTGNQFMLDSAMEALRRPSSMWQRMPALTAFFGRFLIRSQAPDAARKYTAPAKARPITSEIPGDIIQRFVDQDVAAAEWMRGLDEGETRRVIMVSPFVRAIAYSVLDGCRLIAAHDRRHFEQARRVMLLPEFGVVSTMRSGVPGR